MTRANSTINRGRAPLRLIATVGLALATVTQPGCVPIGTEFREAAGPALEEGLNSIMDGLLDGLFAAIEPDGTDSSD